MLLEPLTAQGASHTGIETDAAGEWVRHGLAPGIWRIEVRAAGHRAADGKVEVAGGATAPVAITLEVDGDAVVKRWLSEANQHTGRRASGGGAGLLRAGADRSPRAARPRRCSKRWRWAHFLQGDVDAAVKALQRAILAGAGSHLGRELLVAVLTEDGRFDEADAWLALLDSQGPTAAARAAFGTEIPSGPLDGSMLGRFRAALQNASPHSAIDLLLERIGSAEELGVDPDRPWSPQGETVELYVPDAPRQ